jgi:predicted PurR-regulated permease PerM
VVIIVLLIGSSLAGLAGALIALPVTAALKVVIREVRSGTGPGDLSPLCGSSSGCL